MKAYQQRRVETAGGKIEDLLTSEPPLHKEVWHHMKGWYKVVDVRASPPARITIKSITAEQVALHHHIPSPRENTPIYVDTFLVDELIPTEDDIKWAVRRLRNNRSGIPYGMRAEHLQQWI